MAATDAMKTMPWIRWLDLDTEMGDDGRVRSSLRRPKAEHLNHNGHVNAAVAYGVAEVAGAGAVVLAAGSAGTGAYTVIKSGTIDYRRPAVGGISASASLDAATTASVEAALQAGQGCDVDVDVALDDAAGNATGRCTFVVALRPPRPA